ncbi:hypothetical protein HDR66_03030 [bacterium]|nr:hypothetical protein [bacterium]
MLLKMKICSTVFILYEILAVLLLHCPYTCTWMFGNTFCTDSVFKYFIALFAFPALVFLILMWVMHIIHAIRRRNSFLYRAQEAVEDVTTSLKKTLKETVTGKDIQKYIVAALAAGVRQYSDAHPEMKQKLGNIINAAMKNVDGYVDVEIDDEPAASHHTTRRTASRTTAKRTTARRTR